MSATVILSFIALEVCLRFTDYRYLLSSVRFPDGYFISDVELGADHAPDQPDAFFSMRGPGFPAFTNSLGCFDRDTELERDYVLAIGDSATWGFVPAEKNWTHILQELSGRQVLNCGVSGVGTRFELLKAQRVIEEIGHPPSLIILLYINNDLNDDYVFPSYTVISGQRLDRVESIDLVTGEVTRRSQSTLLREYENYQINRQTLTQKLREHSLTAWLLYRLFVRQEETGNELSDSAVYRYGIDFWNLRVDRHPWIEEAIEYHLESFRDLRQFADSQDTRLVVFDEGPVEGRASSHRADFFSTLERELEFVFPITFETLDSSEVSDLTHKFDSHWSEFGNRQAAEEIFRKLQLAELF